MKGSQWKGRKNKGRKIGKRKEGKKGRLNFQLSSYLEKLALGFCSSGY